MVARLTLEYETQKCKAEDTAVLAATLCVYLMQQHRKVRASPDYASLWYLLSAAPPSLRGGRATKAGRAVGCPKAAPSMADRLTKALYDSVTVYFVRQRVITEFKGETTCIDVTDWRRYQGPPGNGAVPLQRRGHGVQGGGAATAVMAMRGIPWYVPWPPASRFEG